MPPPELDRDDAARVIAAALAEDVGSGDVTSAAIIPENCLFRGVMSARDPMVVAGLEVAAMTFAAIDGRIRFTPKVTDGDEVAAGTVLAAIDGPAAGLLSAERTALNLLQAVSGIATLTRRYVQAIAGTKAVLLDTRKTIPGLRRLSKYAAACGGAYNHRMGLWDAVLIKDNHLAVCGGIEAAVAAARGHGSIEVECDTLEQVDEAVRSGADIVLLDNMTPGQLRQAVALVAGRARTEASGGVTLETIRAIAETGVEFISVGRITQSAPAVDIGLDWSLGNKHG